jgi:MFS family permease
LSYFRFVTDNARLLAFGFLVHLLSGFGQTFFIGLFGAEFRSDFGLSHGEFGFVYSMATLTSAAGFIWAGRQIDRIDLRLYTGLAGAMYVVACLWIALTPATAWLLFVGFTLVRLAGQSLMTHIGGATMARYFEAARGRAVSLGGLGLAAAEATLPPLGVHMLAGLGWRGTWLAIAALLAFIALPVALRLLRGQPEREQRFQERRAASIADAGERDWLLREVLRDPHFYLVMPTIVFTPFVVTGIFFHQAHVVELKGWSLELFASAFVLYATATVLGMLVSGPLVDRIGARRIVALLLVPLALGLLALALSDNPAAVLAFMLGAGMTNGAGLTLISALWAEMYGATHIGSIRSLVWTVIVVATAVASVLFGALLDAGVSVEAIATACLVAAVAAAFLAGPFRHLWMRSDSV